MISSRLVWFRRLAAFGALLALLVVVLGAWVRLNTAGLGCPDWPGCYGHLTAGAAAENAEAVNQAFPERPVEYAKAVKEMVHRYFAITLGLVCVVLAIIALVNRKDSEQPVALPVALVGLVILQGLLGMWTVTLLLKPLIVTLHLIGGLATMSLLAWLAMQPTVAAATDSKLKTLAVASLAMLSLQIALGGWTSSNYAAVACPDFPTCQAAYWPEMDAKDAFVLWRGLGIDYEGGVLDHPARVAVHFTHRMGAVLATLLIALLGWRLVREPATRADGAAVLAVLLLQLSLGVSIVWFGVPLPVAVLHNGVAALLLLAVINANQRIRQR